MPSDRILSGPAVPVTFIPFIAVSFGVLFTSRAAPRRALWSAGAFGAHFERSLCVEPVSHTHASRKVSSPREFALQNQHCSVAGYWFTDRYYRYGTCVSTTYIRALGRLDVRCL